LIFVAVFVALGDEILAELEGSMEKMNICKTPQPKEHHKRRIELPLRQRIKITSDGVC
jgi:hypothetical protein